MYVPYVIVDISFRCLFGFSNFTPAHGPKRSFMGFRPHVFPSDVYGRKRLLKKKKIIKIDNAVNERLTHIR